jgi:hypothetical protein
MTRPAAEPSLFKVGGDDDVAAQERRAGLDDLLQLTDPIVDGRSPFPFVGSTGSYSRASIAWASRSRSTKGSPLTSTATRLIVPPVKRQGASPG